MGYELWLDSWEGGASRIVFDGSDQPDTMEFTVRTKTSVGVESGTVQEKRDSTSIQREMFARTRLGKASALRERSER